jgi:hypothetical protein
MKKSFILYPVAALAIWCSALFDASALGWDNRFFPTTNASARVMEQDAGVTSIVFASDVIVSNMIDAVNERWEVAFRTNWPYFQSLLNTNTLRIEYPVRDPHGVLDEIKLALYTMLGEFVDMNLTTNGPNDLIFYTPESLAAELGLPPEYLFITPDRNLMDYPSTNPALNNRIGYGWSGAYKIINKLTHTYLQGGFYKLGQGEVCSDGLGQGFERVTLMPAGEYVSSLFGFDQAEIGYYYDDTGKFVPMPYYRNVGDYGQPGSFLYSASHLDSLPSLGFITNTTTTYLWQRAAQYTLEVFPNEFTSYGETYCPPGYAGDFPNSLTMEKYQTLCGTDPTWGRGATISGNPVLMPDGSYYLLEIEQTISPPCNALDVLDDMQCWTTSEVGDIGAGLCITEDDEGNPIEVFAPFEIKRAYVSGGTIIHSIIDWGFRFK